MMVNDYNTLLERLRGIVKALPDWMAINRDAIIEQVLSSALNSFRDQSSPEPIEGIETGLDFLGLLLTEGGENGLYEITMEQLDGEIYSAVASLDDDEQIVLLLPVEASDLDDLFADRDINEWPRLLRSGIEWPAVLRELVLGHVDPKSRQ